MSLVERIRIARKEAGLTQVQLAELLSVDRTMVVAYEKGKYAISMQSLESLAEIAGRPLAWFFLEPGQKIVPESNDYFTREVAYATIRRCVDFLESASNPNPPEVETRLETQSFQRNKSAEWSASRKPSRKADDQKR